MNCRIIKAPSKGCCDIIQRRIDAKAEIVVSDYEALALIQGGIPDMCFAADIAEKSSGVIVIDVRGNCPQNLVMIAILGDTASVENAVEQINTLV